MRHIVTVSTQGEADCVQVYAYLDEHGYTYRMVLRFFSSGELISIEGISADDAPEIAEINVAGAWDLDYLTMLLDEFDTEIEKVPANSLALGTNGAERNPLSRLSI